MNGVNKYVFEKLDGDALESFYFLTADEGTFASLFKKTIKPPKAF